MYVALKGLGRARPRKTSSEFSNFKEQQHYNNTRKQHFIPYSGRRPMDRSRRCRFRSVLLAAITTLDEVIMVKKKKKKIVFVSGIE